MARTCLGIDIGKSQLKLVLMKGESIKKAISVQMPEGLLKEGRIVSVETAGELLRKTMKENKIRCREAAVLISSDICYLRNVTMPEMTADQLVYNLPYEFRDYITEELKAYVFDYSLSSGKLASKTNGRRKKNAQEEDAEEGRERSEMELLAAAISRDTLEDIRLMLRKAGLKLVLAAPKVAICETLFLYEQEQMELPQKEYGILDIGSTSSRLLLFKNGKHQATRVIELGMENVEEALADAYNIDMHLAHTWLLTNHEDCVHSEACREVFSRLSVELMRALNFYQFSNPDSHLEDIWLCGGLLSLIRKSLEENLQVNIRNASELLEKMNTKEEQEQLSLCFLAAAAALAGQLYKKKQYRQMRNGESAELSKKQLNFAAADQKKRHYFAAIFGIAAIVAAAAVFGKTAVSDRLTEVELQKRIVSELELQVLELEAYIENLEDFSEVYAHYTYQGLTGEELSYINRPEVLTLLEEVIFPKVEVSSFDLSGNQLTLSVTGAALEDINLLVQQLEMHELVDFCNIKTAVTEESKENGEQVTGQLTVYLADMTGVALEDGQMGGTAQ